MKLRAFFLAIAFFGMSAQSLASDQGCVDYGIVGGGEVPIPFGAPNQKVELANGECYVLLGTIDTFLTISRIFVDLQMHPWLANRNRVATPYYYVSNPDSELLDNYRYSSAKLKFFVRAHSVVYMRTNGEAKYAIELEVLSPPERYRPAVR